MPVYKIGEMQQEWKDKYFFVIADCDRYVEIKSSMEKIGMEEYRDFIDMNNFGKKLVIIYGNCHMDVLQKYLENNPYFYSQYTVSRKIVNWLNRKVPSSSELALCDVLITQDIREKNELGVPSADELEKMVSPKCRCIKVVNLHGLNFFFPQSSKELNPMKEYSANLFYRHFHSNAIYMKNEDKSTKQLSLLVKQIIDPVDYRIELLAQKDFSVEEIGNDIVNGEVYSAEEIRYVYNSALQKLKEREKRCDIAISDYIEENYRELQLFYDINHPTETLIAEKGRRILKLLNLPLGEEIPLPRMLNARERFVYGCVRRELGIRYSQDFIRLGWNRSSLSNKAVDLKTFVEDYLLWIGKKEDVLEYVGYDNYVAWGIGCYYEKNKNRIYQGIKINYVCDKKFSEKNVCQYEGLDVIGLDEVKELKNTLVIIFAGTWENYVSMSTILEKKNMEYVHASILMIEKNQEK